MIFGERLNGARQVLNCELKSIEKSERHSAVMKECCDFKEFRRLQRTWKVAILILEFHAGLVIFEGLKQFIVNSSKLLILSSCYVPSLVFLSREKMLLFVKTMGAEAKA
jgi:hypothetical protein